MQKVSITEAREKLPKLTNEVYFNAKTFLITKRGIPIAKITQTDKTTPKMIKKGKNVEKALKLARSIKWIWDDEWKNKTTEEIADLLAERAWNSHAS